MVISSKTVAQELWLKSRKIVASFNQQSPDNERLIGGPPAKIKVVTDGDAVDLLLVYIDNWQQLANHLPAFKNQLKHNRILRAAYHKGTSTVSTDINPGYISAFTLEKGSNRLPSSPSMTTGRDCI